MTRNNSRSNATRNENTNAAMQQVKNNAMAQTPANDTPVPAKVEDLEARMAEYKTSLSEAKKQSKKMSEKLAKASDLYANQCYVVAVSHANLGTASTEELALIASRKAEDNATAAIAKAIAAMPKDSDEVAKARELAKSEEGSLSSAIAETLRNWNGIYCTLYSSIGITAKKSVTPALLKDLCPYLVVATADGLKAASVSRSAVRKNGKAVKVKGQRVYKYTLRERQRWTAYGLFETLERNFRWSAFFAEDELKVRRELLDAEVAALAALKAAKDAQKSDVPEQAANAADIEGKLKDAAKAAGKATKQNANNATQHTTKGGKKTKVA